MPEDRSQGRASLLLAGLLALLFLLGLCAAGALLAGQWGASLPRLDLAATQFVLDLQATQTAAAAQLPYPLCVWVWHTEPLPDLSEQLQQALDDAGLETAAAEALAFGENCVGADGAVDRFAIMQTDFVIRLEVEALDGPSAGPVIAAVLEVLMAWPREATPGPAEGYITLMLRTPQGHTMQLRDHYHSMIQAHSTAEDAAALWDALGP